MRNAGWVDLLPPGKNVGEPPDQGGVRSENRFPIRLSDFDPPHLVNGLETQECRSFQMECRRQTGVYEEISLVTARQKGIARASEGKPPSCAPCRVSTIPTGGTRKPRGRYQGANWQQIGNWRRKRGQAELPNPLQILVELIGIEPTTS